MAGRPVHDLSDDTILAAVKQHGTIVAAARSLGISRQTLDQIIGRQGLRERCRVMRSEKMAAGRTPQEVEEVSEVELLRARAKELEDRLRRSRKKDVLEERIIQTLERAALERKPQFSPLVIKRSHLSKSKHEMVLLWSDTHAGEVVSLEETNGIGAYDWEIMMRRQEKLRASVLSYQENRPYPVETLHVLALGDMVGGNIHDELAETNEMPIAEVTVQAGLDFAGWLEGFVPRFKHIKVAGVDGNHGRMHKKPRMKHQFDNFDWITYHTMRLALRKNPSIEFDIPKAAAWPVLVAGAWRILMFHGDGGIRSSMPGVPWGGMTRMASSLQNQYTAAGLPIDIFACGHWHTANVVESTAGRIVINGSVKGVDEFSLKTFGSGRAPQQILLTFHPRNGLTDVSFLDLEDVKSNAERHRLAA